MANRLVLAPRRTFRGSVKGERLTRRKGASVEFADYREYAEGDDLRHLDWNVLARLDMPVMRTYLDEQDLAIYALLDRSPSMDFGSPTKFEFARKLAAMLGLAALNSGDALYAVDMRTLAPTRAMRGRASAGQWLRFASEWKAMSGSGSLSLQGEGWGEGESNKRTRALSACLRSFASSGRRRGVAILVSDGLDPDLPQSLSVLGSSGYEILFAQVLSPMDLDPDLEGDLRLVDSESDEKLDVTANRYALQSYKDNLNDHLEKIEQATRRVGGRHLLFRCDSALEVEGIRSLERGGWVKR